MTTRVPKQTRATKNDAPVDRSARFTEYQC